MTWTNAIEHIAILMISFVIGVGSYIGMSKEPFQQLKKRLDWLLSIVIQLVIYIWLAKVLVLFKLVIKDPFAVLAYPSNATMLYLALLFTGIHIAIHIKKGVLLGSEMIRVFVPVLLSTHFVYSCIQVYQTSRTAFLIQAGIGVLLIIIYVMFEKVHYVRGSLLLLILWSFGNGWIAIIYEHYTLFGYLLSPFIYVGLMVGSLLIGWKFARERKF